jgi:PKD repeat protein
MRSIPLMAATTVILAAAWACGDGGGDTGLNNNPPVAIFTAPTGCTTTTPCTFTDASTDQDGDALTRLWNFGDNTTSTDQTVSHQFAEAKTYSVSLTVTDPDGASNSVTHDVVVGPGTTGNTPPTAAFTVPTGCTVNSACPFADASTDPDANIVAWEWNFGDGTPVDNNQNTNHTFAAASTYQVQLKVTDAAGATNSIIQPVVIAAPTASQCTTVSTSEADCALTITSRSSITLTLTSVDCELGGNLVLIPPPNTDVAQNVFTNACHGTVGQQYTLLNGQGGTLVLDPGFVLHVRLRRGTGTPPPGSPAGKITGTFPTWTLNFDDGGNPGGAGEPDFGDVVVTVQANPA